MNGTAPSTLIAVHISATIAKPSRVLIVLWRLRTGSQNASPIAAASAKVIEKCAAWPSRYTSDTASGRISVVLNSMNSTPRVRIVTASFKDALSACPSRRRRYCSVPSLLRCAPGIDNASEGVHATDQNSHENLGARRFADGRKRRRGRALRGSPRRHGQRGRDRARHDRAHQGSFAVDRR